MLLAGRDVFAPFPFLIRANTMKKTIVIFGCWLAIMGKTSAQTNHVSTSVATNASAKVIQTVAVASAVSNEIVTLNGVTYKSIAVEKVEPDGLTISYAPARGGLGITKIPFESLPVPWQKKYNYDPTHAIQYHSQQLQALGQWRQQTIHDDEVARWQQATFEAQEEAREAEAKLRSQQLSNETMEAEAAMIQATNPTQINVIQQQQQQQQQQRNYFFNSY